MSTNRVVILSLLLSCLVAEEAAALKILMLPHAHVVSHMRLFYKVGRDLVARGHELVVLRWPPVNDVVPSPPAGARVIEVFGTNTDPTRRQWVQDQINLILWKEKDTYWDYLKFKLNGGLDVLRPCLELQTNYGDLLEELRRENFSLAITDPWAYPCSWLTANLLGIPYVSQAPCIPTHFLDEAVGTPTPFSYCPSIIDGCSDRMSLLERAKNILDQLFFSTGAYWKAMALILSWMTHWPDIRMRPLMAFYNTDVLLEYPRPLTHNYRYIGLKTRTTQTVQDEMTSFTNDPTSKGTIIFSLTTLGNKELMSEQMKTSFLNAFKELGNYRIIWRSLSAPDISDCANCAHIRFSKWFNQSNLLGDPKTRLLITHGGISTILEALRHGIPMLGMPMSIDHYADIRRVVSAGTGESFTKSEMTSQLLLQKIHQILDDQRYQIRATKLADMADGEASLMDNPQLWWTEYAARHSNQRDKLVAAAELDLSYAQYFLLDCSFPLVLFSYALYYIVL